jgi:hypothetical protein
MVMIPEQPGPSVPAIPGADRVLAGVSSAALLNTCRTGHSANACLGRIGVHKPEANNTRTGGIVMMPPVLDHLAMR